jgi:hypothetical protein
MSAKDLTGRKFGLLTVIERALSESRATHWLWRCACGNTKVVRSDPLVQGKTTSCAGRGERAHGVPPQYFTAWRATPARSGSKLKASDMHGSLRVVSYVGEAIDGELWGLDCVCGKAKILPSAAVLSGGVVDCGTCEAAHERVSNAHLAELIARTRGTA